MTEQIRFDNAAALEAKIGEDFGPWSNEILVDQARINAFAEVTEDRQWIHIDVDRATNEGPFGGPIAHGFLTLSLVAGFEMRYAFEITDFKNIVNVGSDRLRFMKPVPVGSKLHARIKVIAVKGSRIGTRVTSEVNVHIVGDPKPCLVYDSIVLYQG